MYLEVNDLYISHTGNLSKTCTADGWTEMDPMEIAVHCGYNLNGTLDDVSAKYIIKMSIHVILIVKYCKKNVLNNWTFHSYC